MQVTEADAAQPLSWGAPSDQHCFIILMEVLDNCPHDKVVRAGAQHAWQQAMVASPEHGPPVERLQPLSDPLVQECLAAADWPGPGRERWRSWLHSIMGSGEQQHRPPASCCCCCRPDC